jgi:hypothetical protein
LRAKWWLWLVWVFVAWKFATTIYGALSEPWRWTLDQYMFVFFLACIALVAAVWTVVWLRDGTGALKLRWQEMRRYQIEPASGKGFGWNLVFWIAVAIGLTVFFNTVRH